MQDTILIEDDSLTDLTDPFTGKPWTTSEIQAIEKGRKKRELVRLRCVEEYSSSPLYQAMAAKDPEYWKNFSTGQVNL